MYVMRAFVGVYRFQVYHMAHHLIFIRNAIAAVHITGMARDFERLADIVALHDRNHIRREPAVIHQAANAQASLKAKRYVTHHIGEFLLEQLCCRQWTTKLVAVEGHIGARRGGRILLHPSHPS